MARVIYTGPLNPVIFARAKKEAEKAERIKGYKPRVIKTPTHTVVYNKTGPEVKAVVMDMMAPITFSIPGSAIPVAPIKTPIVQTGIDYGDGLKSKDTRVTATGNVELLSQSMGAANQYAQSSIYSLIDEVLGYRQPFNAFVSDQLAIDGITRSLDEQRGEIFREEYVGEYYSKTVTSNAGVDTTYMQPAYTGSKSSYGGSSTVKKARLSTGYDLLQNATTSQFNWSRFPDPGDYGFRLMMQDHDEYLYTANVQSFIHGQFIVNGISRLTNKNDFYGAYSGFTLRGIDASFSNEFLSDKSQYGSGLTGGVAGYSVYTSSGKFRQRLIGTFVIDSGATISADGSCFHPSVEFSEVMSRDFVDNSRMNIEKTETTSKSLSTRRAIRKNLESVIVSAESLSETLSDSKSSDQYGTYFDSINDAYVNASTDDLLFVAASSRDFDGVLISKRVYVNDAENKQIIRRTAIDFGRSDVFVKSGIAEYFDIRGKIPYGTILRPLYATDNFNKTYHNSPPKITTSGVCLSHAWFFVPNDDDIYTDKFPNHRRKITIVIYPQGRHEFSVDEAEIVSVELNHTPRFVARPGGGIAFVMQSLFGGNKLVPYVVNGLVEERDEYGEPTGFYLAQDGAISGEFKAHPNGGSNPFASFKLSPRQVFDGYRTVTVETTTEREYGVQTTFEVQGSGGVRVQQPPSITLERINESVLAGQSTVFYVTATQIANGSNLRYEIKRAGTVVSAGYIELGNCAGWVEFTAPFRSVSVPGDPVRYALGDRSAPSATPSTVEFEFSLIHEQAPPPVTFSVKFAHELYASSTDRPVALPMPPLFFLQPLVSENGEDDFIAANYQTTLINRIYYSLQSKRVYVLFWDGQSCDVSGILKKNQESGQYEYNPDWKETSFDYPPAVDPYNIKGTLEPYVYAYMDYENNRNNGA